MKMLSPVDVAPAVGTTREIERLRLKVGDLQSENAGLRRRLSDVGEMRRLRQAYRDAKAMLMHRFNGYSISRDNCLALGISERHWTNARALLQTARVHNGIDVTESELDAAINRLDTAFKSMEEAGTAQRMKMRLPNSRMWIR